MKQLLGADNLFLTQESGNQRVHVAGLAIYDPSTAPGGKVRFKDVLEFFTKRLDKSPVFRRRLVRVPLDLDRPYWIEDEDIDVEYHVRHIALPHPGDWRQLMIQVSRIHARPLDLSKPAWGLHHRGAGQCSGAAGRQFCPVHQGSSFCGRWPGRCGAAGQLACAYPGQRISLGKNDHKTCGPRAECA